jgi:methyl-accepting chemotaxis protein
MAMWNRMRFPIFSKILGSCLLLAGLMITLSYAYARYRESKSGRGRYLDAYLKRYLDYQDGMGQALAAVADIIAADATLRVSLSPSTAASQAVTSMMGGAPAESPATAEVDEGARKRAAGRAADIHAVISGRNSIRPSLFILFDRIGRPVYLPEGSPVVAADLRELEAVARVRAGNAFFNKLMLHAGHVYQVAGVPVHAWGGDEVVGGVLIGVPIERHFEAFKRQSDELEKDQLRLSLVSAGTVLASVFPEETWSELADAVSPSRRQKIHDGPDVIDVVSFDKQQWDYHAERVTGYSGAEQSQLGMLVMMKNRAGLPKQEGFVFAALTGVSLALVVALLLALWITRPVRRFIHATTDIAHGGGDLTRRIDVTSNDELGDLAHNLNHLFSNLHTLARDVQSASLQVGTSSAEIGAASKQMLEGAKDQAVKIEGSTAAVTELSASIQQVAAHAIEATKVARQSNEAVGAAIGSMNQIRRTVEDAAERIQELGESGKRIGNIVEVIRQISEQTSLLALNASIEAAHAGEQGRGFAVVADEVSSLAKRVGQSAKDIEDLIATIKEQTADAVRAMNTGTSEVESGTAKVTSTLENLKHIIDVVQSTAGAVQEQAIASDEIARNMDAVQKIANEVVSSSEEAVIQGEELHKLAIKLEASVRGFNLDGAPEPEHRAEDSSPTLPAARRQLPANPSSPPALRSGRKG